MFTESKKDLFQPEVCLAESKGRQMNGGCWY